MNSQCGDYLEDRDAPLKFDMTSPYALTWEEKRMQEKDYKTLKKGKTTKNPNRVRKERKFSIVYKSKFYVFILFF